MSILNPTITGGGSGWSTAVNVSGDDSHSMAFPVSHRPTKWAVFKLTGNTSSTSYSRTISYIPASTHYGYYIYKSGSSLTVASTSVSSSYNSGTFTITSSSGTFATSAGVYVLVYV